MCKRLIAWRWYIGIGLFALFVSVKAHGFSFGTWNNILPETTESYRYLTIGKDRSIRSDEFMVSVPMVMAQCNHSSYFPRINERSNGTGMDMFLTTPPGPVWNLTVLGQVQNWGYFIFGFERGLSWNWFIRYIGVFLFALDFFLIWTRRDVATSFIAALAVTLGAPTQWWTTTIPYTLLFFFSALVFLHKLFGEAKVWKQSMYGVGLFFSICSFGFAFYPPFQLLLGVIMLFVSIEFIVDAVKKRSANRYAWVVLAIVFLAWAAEWAYVFQTHRETIENILNSSYPGGRRCLGGSVKQAFEFQAYKLLCLFTPVRDVKFLNFCEVSMFFVPLTALTVVAIRSWKTLQKCFFAFPALCIYGFILQLWISFTWPQAIANYTGLSIFPPRRAAVILGFLFIFLTFKVFSECTRNSVRISWKWVCAVLGVILVLEYITFKIHPFLWNYFSEPKPYTGMSMLLFATILLLIISAGLMRSNKSLFLGGYLICSLLTGLLVNPLSIGASPLIDKQLVNSVRLIQKEHGDGLWMCNFSALAQFIVANGAHCLNGVHQAPHPDIWRRLDPEGRYETVWNRYAHVSVGITTNAYVQATNQRVDTMNWLLNKAAIDKLGVKYLIWSWAKLEEPWALYEGSVGAHSIYRVAPGWTSGGSQ